MSVAMWNCHSWPLDVSSIGKVGLSIKCGVAVFKTSILDSLGSPSAKVGSSAKFGVAVFKVSILNSLDGEGGPSAKVGSSAKFGVAVFKASILHSQGGEGPSAKISFNNNITYYTWQMWALIVECCNCHVGVLWWCWGMSSGLHLTWLYSANWLFTTLINQK